MASNFEIGATEGSLTPIDLLDVELPDMKSDYFPYSRKVQKGNGEEIGVGAPYATWTFPVLEIDQYNQLRAFSGNLVIRTKLDDDTFAVFNAYASFPLVPQSRWFSMRQNYVATFRNLVLIPEGS